MKLPQITVLMPVYNCESYINEAIDSILSQTYSDFELLIIDDASTDATVAVIRGYSDPRIRLVEKKQNAGLIDSLNLGLELATGKYIARMDGDDYCTSDRFQKQLDILENNAEIKVCGCWLQQFGKKEERIKHREHHDEIVARMLLSCAMTMGSVMFDRKALEAYRFDEAKKHVEDYDFWSRIAWSCKLYNIQEVLYYYRVHETQVSTIHKQIQIEGDIAIKLFLFKKLNYSTEQYPDDLIKKMILLEQPIQTKELLLFVKWLKALTLLNRKTNTYSQKELELVLDTIKKTVLFSIYFTNTPIGITKKWRIKALVGLPLNDILYILKFKKREIIKAIFKNGK